MIEDDRTPVDVDMPYRVSDAESCAICRKVATSTCIRCSRPLCPDHAHRSDRRCELCERWFEEHRVLGRDSNYSLEIPSRAARVILCFTPIWPLGVAAIIKEAEKKRRRRRFLSERLGR